MKANPQFDPPEEKAARRGAKRRQAVQQMVDEAVGKPGIAWREWHAGRVLVAVHDGRGGEGCHSALSLNQAKLGELIDRLIDKLHNPAAVPAIAREVRITVEDKTWEIQRLQGDLQVLRWRIMHLEREAAERDAARVPPPYSDATALALVPTAWLAVVATTAPAWGEERAA